MLYPPQRNVTPVFIVVLSLYSDIFVVIRYYKVTIDNADGEIEELWDT